MRRLYDEEMAQVLADEQIDKKLEPTLSNGATWGDAVFRERADSLTGAPIIVIQESKPVQPPVSERPPTLVPEGVPPEQSPRRPTGVTADHTIPSNVPAYTADGQMTVGRLAYIRKRMLEIYEATPELHRNLPPPTSSAPGGVYVDTLGGRSPPLASPASTGRGRAGPSPYRQPGQRASRSSSRGASFTPREDRASSRRDAGSTPHTKAFKPASSSPRLGEAVSGTRIGAHHRRQQRSMDL